MKTLLLFKPGSLSEKMLARARSAGFCCIETNDLEAIKVIEPTLPIDNAALLKDAMLAIKKTDMSGNVSPRAHLGSLIAERLSQ